MSTQTPETVETATAVSSRITPTGPPVVLAENPFVTVQATPVTLPDGTEGEYSTITSGTGYGALIVPAITFRGRRYFGLVELHRFPEDRLSLEFPRGGTFGLDQAEALRELIEETGLQAASMHRLAVLNPDTGILTTKVGYWWASITDPTFHPENRHLQTPGSETEALHWLTLAEIRGRIETGKIHCAMTIAALTFLS